MASSGLKDSEDELNETLRSIPHARRAIEIGFAILETVGSIKLKNGNDLQVKIGVHTGPVTAGVVGYYKPQFSLVGDTVNTASRMCSTIRSPNTIQISSATRNMVGDVKGLIFSKTIINAKGLGKVNAYLVSEAGEDEIAANSSMMTFGSTKGSMMSSFKGLHSPLKVVKKVDSLMSRAKTVDAEDVKTLCKFNCKEDAADKCYRLQKMKDNYSAYFITLVVASVTYLLLNAVSIIAYFTIEDFISTEAIIGRGIGLLLISLITIFLRRIYLSRTYCFLMALLLVYLAAISLDSIDQDSIKSNDLVALELMYVILLCTHSSGMNIPCMMFSCALILLPWFASLFIVEDYELHLANSILLLGFTASNCSAAIIRERSLKAYYSLQKLYDKDIEATQQLLSNMLPPWVLPNLLEDKEISEILPDVTLLYADIVGFTAWSLDKAPTQVVTMLSHMFTQFDEICMALNLQKVHTIGDCYVVMSIKSKKNRNTAEECLNVVKMGKKMIEVIHSVNAQDSTALSMRIGIHTGQVIGGVTGSNIIRYDIYGPDVLIANKIESEGASDRINVSDTTKSLLELTGLSFEFNKEIVVTAIGRKHFCYFLV